MDRVDISGWKYIRLSDADTSSQHYLTPKQR